MAALDDIKRLVIKIGSALLVDRKTGALRHDWLQALADDVAFLKARGCDVVLVSSGSIALGRGALDLSATKLALEEIPSGRCRGSNPFGTRLRRSA